MKSDTLNLLFNSIHSKYQELLIFPKLRGEMFLSDRDGLHINFKNVPRYTKNMGLLRVFYVHVYNLEFGTPFSRAEPEPEPDTQNLKSTYEFKDRQARI